MDNLKELKGCLRLALVELPRDMPENKDSGSNSGLELLFFGVCKLNMVEAAYNLSAFNA